MLTLPSGITALRGLSSTRAPIFLVEIQWPAPAGTKYFSAGEQVTWNGHTWEKNRCMSIPTFQAGMIDRKTRDFDKLEIVFDNLADDGSSSFPFTALEAGQNLEDAKVFVYAFSPDAADAVLLWWGYTQGRSFGGADKTFKLSASFFWDSLDIKIPNVKIQQKGFSLNASSGKTSDDDSAEEFFVPLVYGVSNFTIRPLIYNHWVDNATLKVEFIISGTHSGLPFNSSDVTAANFKLGPTPASVLEFYPGNQVAAPVNLTRFPENQIHPLVAFGYAEFPVNDQNKDIVDDLKPGAIKAKIVNGRPLVDTTLPSENPVLILKDIPRDPIFSTGLTNSTFDATAVTSAANYVGTRYQALYNLKTPVGLTELVQRILGDCHCYLTFESGLIQINAKRNNETSVATFATCDSGQTGRKVEDDFADASIKDSSELVNEFSRKFRTKSHPRRWIVLSDTNAQARAGGTAKKVVSDEVDTWDGGGLYDETQNQINAAIALREEQNGDLFPSFSAPFWDALDVSPGDVVTLRTVDVFNNAVNKDVRITKKTIDVENGKISFESQIYKQAIYNDDANALGVDLLRGGLDSVIPGRPPDVTPVSLAIVNVGAANDVEGKQATIRATFTVPAFDPTSEQADGLFREPPIAKVEIWWSWSDEPATSARYGNVLMVTQAGTAFTTSIDFLIDYHKSRSVVAYFVSVAPNGTRSPLGLIPDPTKVTTLPGNLPINIGAGFVASIASLTVGDYVGCEREINKVALLTAGTPPVLTFVIDGSLNRVAYFGTTSIAHPSGTEIAVLKQGSPSLTLSLSPPRFTYATTISGVVARPRGDGVNIKWNDPVVENAEDFGIAYSTDSDAGTNVAKLGSASPSWYTTDPLSPPASVKILWTKSLHKKIHQEDLGGPNVVVFARVFARNNKRNYSPALSALVSGNSSGTAIPDAATTSSPSAPKVNPHTSKIKVICKKPTSNFNEFQSCGIVARVKNGSTVLGYVVDGATGPTNSATEFKNVLDRSLKDIFNWDKSAILALYPTATTIEFYNYITNGQGEGAASAAQPLTISTWTADAVLTDTDRPNNGTTLTAPTVYFDHGIIIDFDLTGIPQMNTHLYNSVRVATLSETVPTRTITSAPNTASPTTITTSGAHGFSEGQTVVISGVLGNTAVNGTWTILKVPSTTTFTIPVAGSGAYTSGGSVSLPGAFLDIPTKSLSADGTATKKQIGKGGHAKVHVTRHKLRELFGPTAHLAIRYFITNGQGETSSAIFDLDLATISDSLSDTGLDQDATIPAKNYAFGLVQLLPGAGFLSSKAAYDGSAATNTVGKDWWDTPAQGGGGGVRIDTTGTRGLKWLKATHNIEIATNVFSLGGQLCCQIPRRQIIAGETYAFQILFKMASGTYVLNNFTASLYDEVNGADIPGAPIAFNSDKNLVITTAYGVVACVFLVDTSYVQGGGRQWLRLKFGENLPAIMYADNASMVNRAQSIPWCTAAEDAGVAVDVTVTGDTGAGGVGSTGGGGNGSGGSCFPAGTLIYTAMGRVPIERLRVGDQVLAVNENGQMAQVAIERLYRAVAPLLVLQMNDGRELLTTIEHPLLRDDGHFVAAGLIRPGESIETLDGKQIKPARIGAVIQRTEAIEVFNLEVDEPHTFIANAVVVHNKIAPGEGGGILY